MDVMLRLDGFLWFIYGITTNMCSIGRRELEDRTYAFRMWSTIYETSVVK